MNLTKNVIYSLLVCAIAGCAGETPFDDEPNAGDNGSDLSAIDDANRLAPEQASGTSSFSNLGYTAVNAGEYHTLAVRSDGRVFATGSNYFGQLGNGTTKTTYTSAPTQVAGLYGVTSVAAGCYHSLALTSAGRVYAWGAGDLGQLGNGTTTPKQLYPVQISTLQNIKAIAAGCLHSLAIDANGRVWAWGFNSWGQVGNGSYTDALLPVQLPNLTATAVDGGEGFSLALRTDGVVMAWGNNSRGQLARGNTTSSATPIVTMLTGISAISAGANHGIATQNNDVLAWGDNTYGELGVGSTNPSFSAMPILCANSPWVGINSATAGRWFNLVATGTMLGPQPPGLEVYHWGYNAYGELGNGTTISASQHQWPAVRYAGGQGVFLPHFDVVVSAGGYHAAAIDIKGQVVAWGRNESGQLGNGSTTNSVWASATLFP